MSTRIRISLLAPLVFLSLALGIQLPGLASPPAGPGFLAIRPAPKASFHGAVISVNPKRRGLAVSAVIVNRGPGALWVFEHGELIGWRLRAFSGDGRPLRLKRRSPRKRRSRTVVLRPGMSLARTFNLSAWPELSKEGVYYLYVERAVALPTGPGGATVGSPILRLTLRKGAPAAWKVVPAVPKPAYHYRPPRPPPPFPPYRVPRTGPIATLAEISAAVHGGDLGAVRRLCYHGRREPSPFYVASAEEAIAAAKMCAAVGKKFGGDTGAKLERGLTLLHPTPESFSRFVAELDPRSLTVARGRASVGILCFHAGRFVPTGNGFRFREIGGRWLLDSRATWSTGAGVSRRGYRLDVEYMLAGARLFGSLRSSVAAGKFATLGAFESAMGRRLALLEDRFMRRATGGSRGWEKFERRFLLKKKKSAGAPKDAPRNQP
jgi:hypothetical protein